MRKLVVVLVCMFSLLTVAQADNDKPVQINQLPTQAQTFIKQYFASVSIALAKEEKDLFDKNYDVIFTNGDKIEFDKNGLWKEVICTHSDAVPAGIIPVSISRYVAEKYAGMKIVRIEQDKKDYEVKLSNGLELKFDRSFNLIDIDK